MRSLRHGGWISALVAVALLLPPGAGAAESDRTKRVPFVSELALRGSKGYWIEVVTFGRLVVLSASSGHVTATYAVRATRADDRIVARFGDRGRISMRFRPTRPARRRAVPECKVEEFAERGEFRGRLDFAGERGFTRVASASAPGAVFGLLAGPCDRPARSSARRRSTVTTALRAVSRQAGKTVSLGVTRYGGGRHFLVASLRERRERMTIVRAATVRMGGSNSFVASGAGIHPASAVLRPPKPFSGTAAFAETGPGSSLWSGSLAVWLPGAGSVPLAGPTFSSSLCRRPAGGRGCSLSPLVKRPSASRLPPAANGPAR